MNIHLCQMVRIQAQKRRSLAAFVLAPLAAAVTINILKAIHHIRAVVRLVQVFKDRGLKIPKLRIPVDIAVGGFIKLAIIFFTLGHADFIADAITIDAIYEFFVQTFEPTQVADGLTEPLLHAIEKHDQLLALDPDLTDVLQIPANVMDEAFGHGYGVGGGMDEMTWERVADGQYG